MQWPNEKGHTMIWETLHRKLRIVQHGTPLRTGGETSCCTRGSSSCTTNDPRCVNLHSLSGEHNKVWSEISLI